MVKISDVATLFLSIRASKKKQTIYSEFLYLIYQLLSLDIVGT